MDIVIPLALLFVGVVIGFFCARFWYTRGTSAVTVKQAENDLKAMLSQQAEHHIFQSKQLIDTVEKQCDALKEQLANYESLLATDDANEKPSVPFYGEHASTYLRNTLNKDAKLHQASSTDTQPRDFADAGSGLFVGGPNETLSSANDDDKGTKG